MNTEQINRFDELMREKLNSYETEPDMDLLVNIHARKNRFLRSRNLTRLIILLAILSAGLLAGYYYSTGKNNHAAKDGNKTQGEVRPDENHSSTREVSERNAGFVRSTTSDSRHYHAPATSSELTGSGQKDITGKNTSSTNLPANQANTTSSTQNSSQNTRVQEAKNNVVVPVLPVHAKLAQTTTSASTKSPDKAGTTSAGDNKNADKEPAPSEKKPTTDYCSAEIEYYTTYDNAFNFMAKSVANDTKLTWSFGDGYNSNEQSPKHTYQRAGQYAVTLTAVNTKTKCKAEAHRLIRVTKGANLSASMINGTIFADAEYAAKTRVDLMAYNTQTNSFDVQQSTYTNNKGFYEFVEIGAGTYIIKTSSYKNYEGAYYGNTTDKEIATNIVVFADDYKELRGYDIQLHGSKYITSTNNNNNDTGGKWMLVLDENNNPIASVMVNQHGQVQNSNNIPSGRYNLLDPATGNIDGNLTIGNDGKGSAGSQNESSGVTTVKPELTLMPNPANDYVKISLSNAEVSPVEVSIINNSGAVVRHFTLNNGADINQIDINSLSVGSYYVIVKQHGITTSSRLVKTMDNR